jgi:hypothetical protein
MSRNGQVVLLVAVPMPAGTVFHRHSHPVHQLAWTDSSVLEVETAEGVWVLPPTRALWLPAGVSHETRATGPTVLRGIYLDPDQTLIDWRTPTPVAVGSLLAALLRHLEEDLEPNARERAEALLPDLLEPVSAVRIDLPMPSDPRARDVAEALIADPADARTLRSRRWGECTDPQPRVRRGDRDDVQPLARVGPHAGRAATAGSRPPGQPSRLRGRLRHRERIRSGVSPRHGHNARSAVLALLSREVVNAVCVCRRWGSNPRPWD